MFAEIKKVIRHRLSRRLGVPEIPLALERLRSNGFNPQQIFDVGAYTGEFAKLCRHLWPSAGVTCFEVLPNRVEELRAWCLKDGNATTIEVLLGANSQHSVPFHEMETASSVLEEHIPQAKVARSYPMRTIDGMVAHNECASPDLLKLDVQGYELEVLKGAETTLPLVSVILAEVNLIDIHKGAPLLNELIQFIHRKGFVAYDICGLTRRPLDQALWQADFIFVPLKSPLRSNKGWQA